MPTYTLSIIPVDALTFAPGSPQPWSMNQGDGAGWNSLAATFSFDPAAVVSIGVQDSDGVLQDDPSNPEWGAGNSHTGHRQVLDQGLTINGTAFSGADSGIDRRIENEYELDVMGSDGIVYRLVAVSLQTDAASPYSSSTVIGFTFDNGLWPPAGVSLTSIPGTAADFQVLNDPAHPPCFTAGTLIATPAGPRAVETLRTGDLVLTAEGSALPLRWIGSMAIDTRRLEADDSLLPVRIAAGALGGGLPLRDLRVSQQHRMMLRSRVAERMFGAAEILVPAKALLELAGVTLEDAALPVTYWHFSLPGHQVVLAEGAPTETLYLGGEILKLIPEEDRDEMYRFYPQLAAAAKAPPEPARMLVRNRPARRLLQRLRRNLKPAVEPQTDTPRQQAA